MSCCGSRYAPESSGDDAWIEFLYVGARAITVIGPVSRNQYRFMGPGARVAIDPRDARSVDGVPNLRRVARPANRFEGVR
jgi:hypothetical protein